MSYIAKALKVEESSSSGASRRSLMRKKLLFLALILGLTTAAQMSSVRPAYACFRVIDCGDFTICCSHFPCPVCP